MLTLFTIVALGFVLGMRHATDPDHVIAVTTIVSRQGSVKHAATIGILWGIGHTITILLVGSAIILFNVAIPPRFGLTMELSVGVMLILLGILNISGIMRWIAETCTPAADALHSHLHVHARIAEHGPCLFTVVSDNVIQSPATIRWSDRVFGRMGAYQIIRPLAVGIVHGLAGSAAVALLVLSTIRQPFAAISYLLVFGIGTIAGMMIITAAIAVPFSFSKTRFSRINRSLGMISGVISVCFGLFIVYQMGFVSGLFGRNPVWIPR